MVENGVLAALQRIEESLYLVHQRLERIESFHQEWRAKRLQPAKKETRRGKNCTISEVVRRLHKAQNDPTNKYDAQTSVSSPHNTKVTTSLVQKVSLSYPNVDPETIVACCKTYFETVRRSFKSQDESLEERRKRRVAAAKKQRKRRLYNARSSVVRGAEKALWKSAHMELMSEEEDAILDGKPVWVVRPPPRSRELTALCGVLQQRLEADKKYAASHHQRVTLDAACF
ncbi:uncharacterized protein LOC129172720 isoform X2 [Dunckerocampus dactyliophorus]|nr:uncharacterized protein LOC129172720 isoform X2 [Dunckerocampus dactyliophorus]